MPTLSTIYTAKPAAQDVKAVTLTHTTAAITNQASEDYNFVISNMSQLLEVSCDVDCRVILYGSSAGRAADTRAYNDYNNDNSIVNSTNLLFDVVLTAGTQNVNNVFLTNREGSNRSTIYAKIFNLSGASSAVEVGLKVVQFGFENDFNLITTQTADCTANDGESIPCDTSGGAFTITTPASGRFKVIDVAGNASTEGFGVNNLTIEAAAGTTIMGDAVLNLDVGAISPEFQLIGTDWRVTNSNYGGVVDSAPPVVTRELLTADRTYYVRTDGDDNNDGLSDTAGGAFLTIQKAIDVVGGLDLGIYNAYIQLSGSFTLTESITLKDPVGAGNVFLQGEELNHATAIIDGNSAVAGLISYTGDKYVVRWLTLTGATQRAASGSGRSSMCIFRDLTVTACGTRPFYLAGTACGMSVAGTINYIHTGGSIDAIIYGLHAQALCNSQGLNLNISGSPTFSIGMFTMDRNSSLNAISSIVTGSFSGTGVNCRNRSVVLLQSASGYGSTSVDASSYIMT